MWLALKNKDMGVLDPGWIIVVISTSVKITDKKAIPKGLTKQAKLKLARNKNRDIKMKQLNGSQGSYTNTDDVKTKGRKGGKNRPRRPTRPVRPGLVLSDCAAKYMTAQSDPFSDMAVGACVPRFPALRSHKVTMKTKFLMANGTNVGFLRVMPCLVNDAPVAHFSNGSFAGTITGSDIPFGTTGTTAAYIGSPYTTADLVAATSYAHGRIVGVGVRIMPVGNTSALGGLITIFVDPDHGNVAVQSHSSLQSRPTAQTMRIVPGGHLFALGPVNDDELDYSKPSDPHGGLYPLSTGDYSTTDPTIGASPVNVVISAGTPNYPFWVEIVIHAEFIGPLTASSGSPSHADPTGFAAVTAAATSLPTKLAGSAYTPTGYKQAFQEAVVSALHEITPSPSAVGTFIGKGAKYLASRAAMASLGAPLGQLRIS